MDLIIKPANKENLNAIFKLLLDNKLPTVDLKEDYVDLFVGLINDNVVASIGLERYNGIGLLRSLAVSDEFKNQKIGDKLMIQLFNLCNTDKIDELYLLTTTAEKYFEKYGFCKIDRNNTPDTIRQTHEFKDICPVSAVVMCKKLN